LGEDDSSDRSRVLTVLSSELAYDPDVARRVALGREAIAIARRLGDDAALFDAIVRTAMGAMVPEYLTEWNELLRESLSLADRAVDPDPAFHSYASFWYAITQAALGRLDGVDEALDVMREAARTVPSPQLRWGLSMAECWRALLAGRCDDAERLAQASYEVASETGQGEAFSFYAGQLFNVRYFQGRLQEMLPLLDQVAKEDLGLPAFWAAVALGHALQGDRDRARTLVDEELARGFDVPYDANWMTGMSVWCEAVAELGHAPAADVLFERLSPWPELMQIGSVVSTPGVAHSLARLATVLGRTQDAERYFDIALAMHRGLESPFLTAHTMCVWAEAIQSVDPDRARAMATDSLKLARQHGFGNIEARASALVA
jgi:tetratricopeptide (TPR) repeat protein